MPPNYKASVRACLPKWPSVPYLVHYIWALCRFWTEVVHYVGENGNIWDIERNREVERLFAPDADTSNIKSLQISHSVLWQQMAFLLLSVAERVNRFMLHHCELEMCESCGNAVCWVCDSPLGQQQQKTWSNQHCFPTSFQPKIRLSENISWSWQT